MSVRIKAGLMVRSPLLVAALALSSTVVCNHAVAQDETFDSRLKAITAQLAAQQKQLDQQEQLLRAQQETLAKQTALIDSQRNQLKQVSTAPATKVAAVPSASAQSLPPIIVATEPATKVPRALSEPIAPVGEAPKKEEEPPQIIQSLPEGLAVLTPPRHFVFTPSVEVTNTTNDRLVYRGVVIVPGINLGEVDASTDARNIGSTVADIRYGITSRLEFEARVPFVWSDDRATILSQGPQGSATQSIYLQDSGIGDIELGARYQINKGAEDWPIFVANARVKTDTGLGPFDIKRDSAGIAQQVALGSGFTAIQGGFSMLKLTDPAVLFASFNYTYNIPKDVNKTIGTVLVGKVEPSNSVGINMGFGFSVNPEFSFSLGYEHSYVFPQYTMLGTTQQQTSSLQVGALSLGAAYRLSPTLSFNSNFEFGVTHDAPNIHAVFSFPMAF